jgi:hypothetical protein
MNILINPYTGTDCRIDRVYELFQIRNPNQKNEGPTGVCRLSKVKMLSFDLIEKEIIKTSESISTTESKPIVYIFALNKDDMNLMVNASKNWSELIPNGIIRIILIDV